MNTPTLVPLYGLALVGGKSTRMGRDKARLVYHGITQAEWCFELLNQVCEKSFLSCETESIETLPSIPDRFHEKGPIGGILSAMHAYPNSAWLVLACDLPFLNEQIFRLLVNGRNQFKTATAFLSASDGMPEPLCAIWEPESRQDLLNALKSGNHPCPRKVLMNSNFQELAPPDSLSLSNVNTPDEFKEAIILGNFHWPDRPLE